jgi:hypothetical protein
MRTTLLITAILGSTLVLSNTVGNAASIGGSIDGETKHDANSVHSDGHAGVRTGSYPGAGHVIVLGSVHPKHKFRAEMRSHPLLAH